MLGRQAVSACLFGADMAGIGTASAVGLKCCRALSERLKMAADRHHARADPCLFSESFIFPRPVRGGRRNGPSGSGIGLAAIVGSALAPGASAAWPDDRAPPGRDRTPTGRIAGSGAYASNPDPGRSRSLSAGTSVGLRPLHPLRVMKPGPLILVIPCPLARRRWALPDGSDAGCGPRRPLVCTRMA
jgi:hypothetical protein